jgi:GNAT superfamily N-acetyltransferase
MVYFGPIRRITGPNGSLKCDTRLPERDEAILSALAMYRMRKQSFRRATFADVSTVSEITRAAYMKWLPVIGREPKPMTADYAWAVADHVIDLLEEGGLPIALIELIPKPSHLVIENIAVLPDQHGKGIGGLLLRHADEIARSLGLNELRLYTNAMFLTNLSFYGRRGFEEFLREPHPAGGEVVHMKKSIER